MCRDCWTTDKLEETVQLFENSVRTLALAEYSPTFSGPVTSLQKLERTKSKYRSELMNTMLRMLSELPPMREETGHFIARSLSVPPSLMNLLDDSEPVELSNE